MNQSSAFIDKKTQDRLDAKINKTPGLGIGDCWEWTASCSPKGYGEFRLNGKTIRAHRVTAWLAGLITSLDSPLEIDHVKCQNKKCVNPDHLQAMTKSEHSKKTHACGERDQHGENNYSAKLAEVQVWDIHQKYATGNFSQRELGEIYDIGQDQISRILSGKCWPLVYKNFHGIS